MPVKSTKNKVENVKKIFTEHEMGYDIVEDIKKSKANHQRKFQLKMGLLTLIQIPCHHVLANEIALNLKYPIGLKHFFNINLGIGIIKKTTFFCLYF